MNVRHLAVLLAVFPTAALAADDIASTKHNLSTTGTGDIHITAAPDGDSEKDQICVFCHTPHHASTDVGVVLWNRKVNTTGYTMYDSGTIDMTIAAQPQTISMACLSCHDGMIAFDALRNGPGPDDYNGNAWARGWTFNGSVNKMPTTSHGYLTQDLTNDHPVSVTFDNTADTMFYSTAAIESDGLRFYYAPGVSTGTPDQVECGTCHNPHTITYDPFLRLSNQGSNLCLTCHIK
ncbi:MAG: cytochrome c3 family protein [Myxococcota bacterium]